MIIFMLKIKKGQFESILALLHDSKDAAFMKDKYAFNKATEQYEMKSPNDFDLQKAWTIAAPYYGGQPNTYLCAHHLHRHRCRWNRSGDAVDDYYKGEYLDSLIKYQAEKGNRIPQRTGIPEYEEAMDQVFHIYDRAYFNKMQHPWWSALECFGEAERYYLSPKRRDLEQRLKVAYDLYQLRQKWNLAGDANDDFYKAEYALIHLKNGGLEIPTPAEEEMVIHIFHRAYFNKIDHPDWSDLKCFVEAETCYCAARDRAAA
jgi:hypothetical protein